LSLVAESGGVIVGHILFFPIHIRSQAGLHPSLALAPVSVLPEFQNQGIGSRLVKAGLEICRNRGDRSVIVLGHKKYYPRFGFTPAGQWGIRCPFPSLPDSFMALELAPEGLAGVEGLVEYPAEFAEVG
jgi:putative acetyltransferase